jgi:hypothetical protein
MKGWPTIAALSLLLIVACSLIERISPRDLTMTRVRVTEARVRSYWRANGRLPASLSALPPQKGRDNSTIDGWGNPIIYRVTGATTVSLSSLGPDNGTGSNQSIVFAFDASKDD